MNPNDSSTSKSKRAQYACLACRKAKKTCEGERVPCKRCEANSLECVFEKPKSSLVNDVGLTRLASIEASVAHLERRTDAILESMGQIQAMLASQIRNSQATGSASGISPDATTTAKLLNGTQGSPSSIVQHNLIVNSATGNASTSTSNGWSHVLPTNSIGMPGNGTLFTTSATYTSPTNYDHRLQFSKPLHGHQEDELSRFEASLGQPLNALAEASAALLGASSSSLDKDSRKRPADAEGREGLVSKLRRRESNKMVQYDKTEFSSIADKDARAWFLFWWKEMGHFCPLLDQKHDTYERLHEESPFLVNALLFTALRASSPDTDTEDMLENVQEATRKYAQMLAFDLNPTLETIQAYLVLACFLAEPYLYSGIAMRLALCARYDTAYARLLAHEDKGDETGRHLTAQLRAYLYAMFLDFKHSRYSGRAIPSRLEDVQILASYADELLALPHTLPNDHRNVANLKYVLWERKVLEDSSRIFDPTLEEHRDYLKSQEAEIRTMYERYDALASAHFTDLAYSRRSGKRIYHDAMLYLAANVYKQDLFDPLRMSAEMVSFTLEHAHQGVRTVLDAPAYASGLKYSGYLLRVDLSFAGMVLLKLAAAHPTLVDADRVYVDVLQLADILSKINDAVRYADMLKKCYQLCQSRLRQPDLPPADFAQQHLSHHDTNSLPSSAAATNLGMAFLNDSEVLLNHDWLSVFSDDNAENWWKAYTTLT